MVNLNHPQLIRSLDKHFAPDQFSIDPIPNSDVPYLRVTMVWEGGRKLGFLIGTSQLDNPQLDLMIQRVAERLKSKS